MPNVALTPDAATRIEVLANRVDGFPDTTHKLETTTGGEPLEDGRHVTDHAVARADRLVLTGWVRPCCMDHPEGCLIMVFFNTGDNLDAT